MSAIQLQEAWREQFGTELKLWILGMKSPSEMSKLFAQFPDAFINKDNKHSAKEIFKGTEFTPRTDKVMSFLYARYQEYYKTNKRATGLEYVENSAAKRMKNGNAAPRVPSMSPSQDKLRPPQQYDEEERSRSADVPDDMDPETKKKYLVQGAKVVYDGDCIGKISSAFPYLNQYWIEDEYGNVLMNETTSDNSMRENRVFTLEELRLPEMLTLEEAWDRELLPAPALVTGSLCQIRTLQDDEKQPNWLDASILSVLKNEEGGTMYQVRIHPTDKAATLNYANRIGNNVPSDFIRWAPDMKKAAMCIAEFIDVENNAMHEDRTFDLDKAMTNYKSAGVKLAQAEQNLSQTDPDYHNIKSHRLSIVKRVQYLRQCMQNGTSPDQKLEDFINPVKLNPDLHDKIIEVRNRQNPDGSFS